MKVFLIGATGRVGSLVLERGLARGHVFTALTRSAARLDRSDGVQVVEGQPFDEDLLRSALPGNEAVIFALGTDKGGRTTLFSDSTRALVKAMTATGVRRLIAVTGVGAGETRGHGGFFYDRILFPFFTRARYEDKDRQEAVIEASALDWTIVRPAPFNDKPSRAPLEVVLEVRADTKLTRISPAEVAEFLLDQLRSDELIRRKPFIGHPR